MAGTRDRGVAEIVKELSEAREKMENWTRMQVSAMREMRDGSDALEKTLRQHATQLSSQVDASTAERARRAEEVKRQKGAQDKAKAEADLAVRECQEKRQALQSVTAALEDQRAEIEARREALRARAAAAETRRDTLKAVVHAYSELLGMRLSVAEDHGLGGTTKLGLTVTLTQLFGDDPARERSFVMSYDPGTGRQHVSLPADLSPQAFAEASRLETELHQNGDLCRFICGMRSLLKVKTC